MLPDVIVHKSNMLASEGVGGKDKRYPLKEHW